MERIETETFEQKRIAELMDRLFDHQKSLRDERKKLWQIEKESEEQYTVLDRLEVLYMFIAGYVSQIATKGYTRQEPHEVISHLHQLSIFNVDCIIKWYPTAEQEYPKIKQFFELLDYIRLLTLDYVQRYRLQEKDLTTK